MVQEYQSPVRVYKKPFEMVMAVSCNVCGFFMFALFCSESKKKVEFT